MGKSIALTKLAAVSFDERFLELSWRWLNESEARKLNQNPEFTREEQRAWFDSLANKKNYFIWGIELGGLPIGAMGLKDIVNESAECWMYIGEKHLWGQRIGSRIFPVLIERARRMGLQRLSARIMQGNTRAIQMAKKLGFVYTSDRGVVLRLEKDLHS